MSELILEAVGSVLPDEPLVLFLARSLQTVHEVKLLRHEGEALQPSFDPPSGSNL